MYGSVQLWLRPLLREQDHPVKLGIGGIGLDTVSEGFAQNLLNDQDSLKFLQALIASQSLVHGAECLRATACSGETGRRRLGWPPNERKRIYSIFSPLHGMRCHPRANAHSTVVNSRLKAGPSPVEHLSVPKLPS